MLLEWPAAMPLLACDANRKRLQDEYRDELGAWAEMLEDARPRYASKRLCQHQRSAQSRGRLRSGTPTASRSWA